MRILIGVWNLKPEMKEKNKNFTTCCAFSDDKERRVYSSASATFAPTAPSCRYCTMSSSSASSSGNVVGSVDRLLSLIESEPTFQRSRSVVILFLRSWSRFIGARDWSEPALGGKTTVFRSVFRSKSKRINGGAVEAKKLGFEERSRSVAVPMARDLKPPAKSRIVHLILKNFYFPHFFKGKVKIAFSS